MKFPAEKPSEIILKALMPEMKKPTTTRSKANMKRSGEFLILEIEANDSSALRAATNAYLRWIHSVCIVLEVLEGKG